MSNDPVRFGVLGLGMGVQHCRDIVDAAGCALTAVCDTSPDRMEKVRTEYGVAGYASYEEMLADDNVDVVSICTPSGTHSDLSVRALRAGKHVVCEKPPDVTVEAVDRMIAARDETGLKLMVVFQSRLDPVYAHLRRAIQAGEFGRLIGVHGSVTWWREESYFDSPGKWKGTWKLDGGGSLANQGIHTLDLVQWLGGRVAEVCGRFGVFAHDIESEDKTVAILTFANGALGTLTTTTAAYPGLDRSILIHGSLGSAVVTDDYLVRWVVRGESPEAEAARESELLARYGRKSEGGKSVASDPFAFATRGHLRQFEAMAEAVRTGGTPPNSVETTRHTIQIMAAIYESGRTGLPVKITAGP